MNKHLNDWMMTFTGIQFFIADPDPEAIRVVDVAHALSMICRFGGHVSEFYSVAQHSVLASEWCDPRLAAEVLIHDAAEAYVGDVIYP